MKKRAYDRIRLGMNIRLLRQTCRLTQKELACRARCSEGTISRLERGACSLSVLLFMRLCRALDCGAADLLKDVE